MSVRSLNYDDIDWSSYVYYDITSRSGLRRVGTHREIGYITNKKYWRITYNKRAYSAHIIVYMLFNGKYNKDYIIDHIDGNSMNNDVTNLRIVTHSHNSQNRKLDVRSTSKITGLHKRTTTTNGVQYWYWCGAIATNKKRYRKSFSVLEYGDDGAKNLAIQWMAKKRKELNASGEAAFTDRHIGIDTSINSSSKQENTLDACFQQD